jgi:hypothetical protein
MTKTVGVVPVRVGTLVVPVKVEAQEGAVTRVDYGPSGAKIVLDVALSPTLANREVESVLPELQKHLARKMLN